MKSVRRLFQNWQVAAIDNETKRDALLKPDYKGQYMYIQKVEDKVKSPFILRMGSTSAQGVSHHNPERNEGDGTKELDNVLYVHPPYVLYGQKRKKQMLLETAKTFRSSKAAILTCAETAAVICCWRRNGIEAFFRWRK
ncbi:MAG: hypothetical protein ACLT16_07065 [[Clostridium] innocuum]